MVTAGTDKQLPKAEVVKNLTAWLQHLEMHPEQDIDCLLELKLPMSYLTRLMIQGEKEEKAPPMVVRELLEKSGYGTE
ncbi:hypothetical protein MR829_23455 [Paracoccus versutus]|uniref:hypothetical protein n=1 Tax=Paracoccus versutus TaxID=34007 RepID=UPI001FB7D9C1|nr:hypothetical protein [Paracoccus versutus]MCJ1903279.1 hypothetical protein [Paracoccus versutus]